jgi:hypothetical protein
VSIRLALANTSLESQQKKRNRILVASLPPSADVLTFLARVMVPFFQTLETKGYRAFFSPTQTTEAFIGGLFGVTGDDISQREAMGRSGPLCQASSRFFVRPRSRFSLIKRIDELEWHDVAASRVVVDELASISANPDGRVTRQRELTKMTGFETRVRHPIGTFAPVPLSNHDSSSSRRYGTYESFQKTFSSDF